MSDVSKVLHDVLGVPEVNCFYVPVRYEKIVSELDKLVSGLPETTRDAALADALHYLLSRVLHGRVAPVAPKA